MLLELFLAFVVSWGLLCGSDLLRTDIRIRMELQYTTFGDLLLFWSNLHRQAPKLNIPGTNFNIGFTLCSDAFLSCIRLLMSQVFLHVLQWDPDNIRTGISTAYSVSIIHSIILCAGLSVVLYHQPYYLLAKLKDAPLDLQEATVALLEFCTGYC